MKPIEFIRIKVFQMKQSDFGRIAGVSQGTVSRWEKGELHPSQDEMARIRAVAIRLALEWNDEWFFVVPLVLVHE